MTKYQQAALEYYTDAKKYGLPDTDAESVADTGVRRAGGTAHDAAAAVRWAAEQYKEQK